MEKQRILRWMSIALLASALSGCSTIKSWFPDKEKDYQFTSEIPELIVPEDLKNKGLSSLLPQASAQAPVTASTDSESGESGRDAAATSTPESDVTTEAEPAQVPASSASDVASTLQIDQSKLHATRMVGRALSRKQIEIVERNIEKGYFYVNFDPHAVEAKDESLWDEITVLFGEDPSKEEEYRITVRELSEQLSEVTVQNSDGKTLSNSVSNTLLRLITDGINEAVDQEDVSDNPDGVAEQKASEDSGTKE